MLQPLNYFKGLTCPIGETCDRVYCLYKHETALAAQSEAEPVPTEAMRTPTPTTPTYSNQTIQSYRLSTQATASSSKAAENDLLPSAIQTFTNAYNTIQSLLQTDSAFSTDASLNKKLNEILNKVANNEKTKPEASHKSPSSSSHSSSHHKSRNHAKVKLDMPVYNPTPICELKRINSSSDERGDEENLYYEETRDDNIAAQFEIESEIDASGNLKKRKLSGIGAEAPMSPNYARKSTEISQKKSKTDDNASEASDLLKQLDEKKASFMKKMNNPSYMAAVSATASASSAGVNSSMKINKLSLQQQLVKRYEVMHLQKPAPGSSDSKNVPLTRSAVPKSAQVHAGPKLILDSTCKVGVAMRQKYLKLFFDECKKAYGEEKACEKASVDEKSIYDRSRTKDIYCNLAAHHIRSMRHDSQKVSPVVKDSAAAKSAQLESAASTKNSLYKRVNNGSGKPSAPVVKCETKVTFSHAQMLNGARANKVSYSINRKKEINIKDLSFTQLYELFKKYALNDKQFEENGFPTEHPANPKLALVPSRQQKTKAAVSLASKYSTQKMEKGKNGTSSTISEEKFLFEVISEVKKCKRCLKMFTVTKDGKYMAKEDCVHHWGKLRSIRVNKVIEQKYSCCSADSKSDGCQIGKHVYDGDDYESSEPLHGYINTKTIAGDNSDECNIFALDCEMCYTTRGLELTRVSVINTNCDTVYEKLVKPDYEIVDYNTRWSGITENDLKYCDVKLADVQRELLQLFDRDTILVGHSLDSDFKALKLIHKTVVDTSVVFPHRMGAPFKRALKNLTSEYLQKIIQEDADGHDSKEDACACMELMLCKVKQDFK